MTHDKKTKFIEINGVNCHLDLIDNKYVDINSIVELLGYNLTSHSLGIRQIKYNDYEFKTDTHEAVEKIINQIRLIEDYNVKKRLIRQFRNSPYDKYWQKKRGEIMAEGINAFKAEIMSRLKSFIHRINPKNWYF